MAEPSSLQAHESLRSLEPLVYPGPGIFLSPFSGNGPSLEYHTINEVLEELREIKQILTRRTDGGLYVARTMREALQMAARPEVTDE